uniref:ABC transporter ATP-binding protein n=1 Tax=Schlesneria paludicola TaxID=360056 RepID=A0A7C4LMD3_9PLAN
MTSAFEIARQHERDGVSPNSAIVLRNLSFAYPGGRQVLNTIEADIAAGAKVAIIGPSGAGKSTLLMHLNGLLPGTPRTSAREANVWIAGQPVIAARLRAVRQQVGFVFQDPDDQLFAATVEDDVAFGPRQLGCRRDEVAQRVAASLAAVGLAEAGPLNPAQLSYGERKRVCLAGVLACRPELLVLDEPSSNLDPRARRQLVTILRNMPVTQVIATHDLDLVLDLCDRVLVLDRGRFQADGEPRRILADAVLMERHGLEVPWRLRPRDA